MDQCSIRRNNTETNQPLCRISIRTQMTRLPTVPFFPFTIAMVPVWHLLNTCYVPLLILFDFHVLLVPLERARCLSLSKSIFNLQYVGNASFVFLFVIPHLHLFWHLNTNCLKHFLVDLVFFYSKHLNLS
jgi:hypothetical protein